MAATLLSMVHTATRCDTPESTLSHTTAEAASSNAQSSSSTPPTSIADSTSVSSPSSKRDGPLLSIFDAHIDDDDLPIDEEHEDDDDQESSNGRSKRAKKVTVKAADWSSSATSSASKKARSERGGSVTRRRTISGETLVGSHEGGIDSSTETNVEETRETVEDGAAAGDLQLPARKLQKSRSAMSLGAGSSLGKKDRTTKEEAGRRKSARFTNEPTESLAKKLGVLGKRGRDAIDETAVKIKREIRRLADTNEFAKIETKPVIHEVWSCGKLVTGNEPPKKKKEKKAEEPVLVNQVWSRGKLITEPLKKKEADEPIIIHEVWSRGKLVTGNEPPKKKAKIEEKAKEPEPVEEVPEVKKVKKWLNRGLYAGQEAIVDLSNSYTAKERKAMAKANAELKRRSILPLPLWAGQRLLLNGRDFKLPFDVCSPLPPGQPKPDEWRKTTKNRFIGDAAALWKKTKHFSDSDSRCICSPSTGCGEDCYNRMMLYECDDGNCPLGAELCGNRAFADLHERRAKGGKYRVGVEVIKTEDRGYGVRANRCFQEGQIIVEYTGEIITEPECQRRMREDYKNNECYYLMLFDQNMIIDATRGSIARFVNHSCEPNCEMVKWIVGGKPHMALFAGKNPIMTGEELTYDYKFDPFSARNVQECRCGAESCRGVLGPRPKEKGKLEGVKKAVKGAVKRGKRKLKELMGGEEEGEKTAKKKRKMLVPVGKSKTAKAVKAKSKPAKAMAKAKKVAKKMGKVGGAASTSTSTATTSTSTPKKSPKMSKSPKAAKPGKVLKQSKLSFGNERLNDVADADASTSSPKKDPSAKAVKPKKSGIVVVKRRGTKVVMKKGVKGTGKTAMKKGTTPKKSTPKNIAAAAEMMEVDAAEAQ
ncbi:hypothetical protein V496_07882 [Pseudogymnoascus sp. VKM F-4515 (FW-2607)]|nr:hypothetical protein V496_07882 [Pseudogymnoascus sp. VKM F-4515 (FW-2607)]KFY94033.1 hypothetical protein V498_04090 [Pseudogymnoascus sp. VKM F-4517 (FW-2822)]